jgi:hypothetical protein
MSKTKIIPIILILAGLAFVLGALFSWFDNLTTVEPVGLGKWIFDVLQFLVGAGAGIGGWLSLRKSKSESSGETTRVQESINSPDSEQAMEGNGGIQKQKSVDSPRSKQTMK